MTHELTLDDLKMAMAKIEDHRKSYPCRCDFGTDFHCERHGIIGCSPETRHALDELMRLRFR